MFLLVDFWYFVGGDDVGDMAVVDLGVDVDEVDVSEKP